MELIADGLLIAGALTAALYCWVLARRVNALKAMDSGLGGAIAGLSARVEQTKASLADTKASTSDITRELSSLSARAEIAAGRLELLLATLHETAGDEKKRPDGARARRAGAARTAAKPSASTSPGDDLRQAGTNGDAPNPPADRPSDADRAPKDQVAAAARQASGDPQPSRSTKPKRRGPDLFAVPKLTWGDKAQGGAQKKTKSARDRVEQSASARQVSAPSGQPERPQLPAPAESAGSQPPKDRAAADVVAALRRIVDGRGAG